MTSDGFGTISAGLVERGTQRVRAILGDGDATVYDPAWQDGPDDNAADLAPPELESREVDMMDQVIQPGGTVIRPDLANWDNIPQPPDHLLEPDPVDVAPSAPALAKQAQQPRKRQAPSKPKEAGKSQAPADGVASTLRGGPSTTLVINEPASGDMSRITVGMRRADGSEGDPHAKDGDGPQRPTSVTYERLSLEEQARKADEIANGADSEPVWVDTPHYAGPDRRHKIVSPEQERRRSVPPRIKVGVRLEQERYLRLKLASQDTERTQQDLMTSALDAYLDAIGVDRFERVAMSFGGAKSTLR